MLRIETCIYIHLQVEYVSVSDKICHYMYMYYFTAQILKTCGVKISDIKVNFKATVLLS